MPRKGLEIADALALLEELPSDPESVISEDESDGEGNTPLPPFPPAYGNIEDDGDDQSENGDINLPGLSRIADVTWNKIQNVVKSVPEFSEDYGPTDEITSIEDAKPMDIFMAFFTAEFMDKLVFETNLYATQKGKPFSPITLQDMLKFLGINILMGIKKLPSYRDFWSTNEILNESYVAKQMAVKKFSWILGNLHLNDNSLMPKREDRTFDKLYKVRPLLTHLSERFDSLFRPGKNQSIDESMIRFKGRSSLKQYLPKKPIKRGYKVWMRCDESGYACKFEIYTGKTHEVEKNLSERVVKMLSEPLYGKNHRVYMDNYFTSYELFKFLETKNVFCCGTVNITRKHLPKTLTEDKKLKRGDFDWAVSDDKITCLKWKDKRCVTILSSLVDAVIPSTVERKEKTGQKIQIQCPKAIIDYNKNMGYVDYFDQLKSLYEIDRKRP
ncbi:PiggyBac transposable element-derived protein 4, partial [Stegodyphus mimosarum]